VVSVSGDDGHGEPAAFARGELLGGVLYVVDRNFLDFAFLGRVVAAGSDFVLRVRANAPAARVVRARAVTADDAAAGVVADEVVELTGRGAPAGRFRRVTLVTADRTGAPTTIRLLTSLVADDVAARVVGAAYRLRWQVELFFKWLKCWARMGHLLSTSRNGITFQLYVAVIAVLMMHLRTGRRVSVYALAALGRLARGELTADRAMAAIARRHREADLNAARQARRRARGKNSPEPAGPRHAPGRGRRRRMRRPNCPAAHPRAAPPAPPTAARGAWTWRWRTTPTRSTT
jgi:hypothetical protein